MHDARAHLLQQAGRQQAALGPVRGPLQGRPRVKRGVQYCRATLRRLLARGASTCATVHAALPGAVAMHLRLSQM